MISGIDFEQQVQTFSDQLLTILQSKISNGPKCYGFEIEFMPSKLLALNDMEALYAFLPTQGFALKKGYYTLPSGMYVTFEPGGQIEFYSIPMQGWQPSLFADMMTQIKKTIAAIHQELGIEYLAVGYIPGRADAPLCLTSDRYRNLHARLAKSGTRGHEMMKGTGAVHLHTGIRKEAEIGPLFAKLIELSQSEEFGMSSERRDIWNHTDPTRSGMPFTSILRQYTPRQLIEEYVGFALKAEDLHDNIPFYKKKDATFDMFLDHITTLFIDVRINLKGPSIELRTLDSLPLNMFEKKWRQFISIMEDL